MTLAYMRDLDNRGSRKHQQIKIVMTILVRNEEDILDWNLQFHYAMGVDFVIATDNKSADTTPEILQRYRQEGRLHYIREESDDYSQSKWVTRMARLAATKYNADWVINNDADEFWLPLRGDLRQTLGSISHDAGCISCERYNFPPVTSNSTASPYFWQRMIIRQVDSTNYLGHPLPRKVCHRGYADIFVKQGNHAVSGILGNPQSFDGIHILHFPIRTYSQFERKISLGGAAYERNSTLPKQVGRTWRLLYELYKQGQLHDWFQEQLIPLTFNEDEVAIPPGFEADTRLLNFFMLQHANHPNVDGPSPMPNTKCE